MKTFWKVLAGAALAAAVVPYRIEGDEETGEIKLKALIWNASFRRNATDECDCDCGCECCADEPEEVQEEAPEIEIEVDLRSGPDESDPA